MAQDSRESIFCCHFINSISVPFFYDGYLLDVFLELSIFVVTFSMKCSLGVLCVLSLFFSIVPYYVEITHFTSF